MKLVQGLNCEIFQRNAVLVFQVDAEILSEKCEV